MAATSAYGPAPMDDQAGPGAEVVLQVQLELRREPPEPSRLGEVVRFEKFPDALLEGAINVLLGLEGRYEQTEAIAWHDRVASRT